MRPTDASLEDAHTAAPTFAAGPLRVDADRFLTALRGLAQIGCDPQGGITRLGLSAEESRAREFLEDLAAKAGLATDIDPAGNLLIRRADADPRLPVLMFGSHIDTVRQGGWLDGAYGVVAALEALTVLLETGVTIDGFEPVAVGFANEEGALVQHPFWGSRAMAGLLDADAEKAVDRAGRPARDYLPAAGGDPERLAEAAWPAGRIAAFLELHIEQGPVLERLGLDIGVVDGIVGRTIFACEVSGEQQHAGTTPMRDRRDALVGAAQLVAKVESLATALGACSTATVGFMDVSPNTVNTIPGVVRLNAEIRDTDTTRIQRSERLLASMAEHVARVSHVDVDLRVCDRSAPVLTDPGLRGVIANAAESLGLSWQAMPSGAGHDAQVIAALAPVGMIFVPSKDGVSHAPGEDSDVQALVAGADVLVTALAALLGGGSPESDLEKTREDLASIACRRLEGRLGA
jgi:N-carbamoyl-L-amino-acid hydrolase